LQDGNYGGTFTQKISIISDKDFTVPAITFKYFDKTTKKEVDITTTPFAIKVTGKKKVQTKVLEQGTLQTVLENNKANGSTKYFYGLGGILFGSLVTFLWMRKKAIQSAPKERPLEVAIQKAKTDKELYDLLLPYSQKTELKIFIKQLEENLYFSKTNKIDKKALLEIFKSDAI
jgi:hypothetical protein